MHPWIRWLVVAGVAVQAAGSPGIAAQEEGGLDRLAPLVGTWELVTYEVGPEGERPPRPATRGEVAWTLEGAGIIEQGATHTREGINPHMAVWSWDSFRQVYRYVFLDQTYGLLDVYEGSWEDGRIVLTNERAETWFRTATGTDLAFRLEFDLRVPERPALHVSYAVAGTEGWVSFMRLEYLRPGDR